MNLFYAPHLNADTCTLDEQESGHILKVLRKKTGDQIQLTDGKGYFYTAEIISAEKKRCLVRILSKREGNDTRNFSVHIAIAPTKNTERLEWFVEKSTEIGIDQISLVRCFHSERKTVNNERLEKVKIAACKQSLSSNFPQIHPLRSLHDFITEDHPGYRKFIAYIDPAISKSLKDHDIKGDNILILIGPEGDFSTKEITLAEKNGFVPISLGKSRLRTETAGIIACHTVHLINE